jgi:hypothetical protein
MNPSRFCIWVLAALALGSSPLLTSALVQDTLLTEITGDYEMQLSTRTVPFKIQLKEGKLYFDALVPGGVPPVLTAVQDKDLTFTTYDPNDDEIVLTFAKDPQGKITGCKIFIPVRDVEAAAVKIVKK